MEIYVHYGDVKDNVGKVRAIIYNPDDVQKEYMPGVLVDDVPEPKVLEGMYADTFINLDTKEIYYQYIPLPPQPPDRIEKLEASDLDNKEAIATLYEMVLMGGM